MTQIGINTQEIGTGFIFDVLVTIIDITISAVDLTRTYVEMQGHATGSMQCYSCPVPGFGFTPKGSNRDGKTGQWAVELFDSTTVRFFRSAPVAPGCRARMNAKVVEYT